MPSVRRHHQAQEHRTHPAKHLLNGLLALLAASWLPGCDQAGDPVRSGRQPVIVFAAASTADALSEIAIGFEAAEGVPVTLNFAATSTLARQIESGAHAEVFIAADTHWMDHLERRGLIDPSRRRDLLGNRLVLVAPRGTIPPRSAAGAAALLGGSFGRLAIADPDHVPAGRYARQALEHLGVYRSLADHLLRAVDVRAALRLAELGEADLAIVYATDAAASSRVEVVLSFDPDSHTPIRYPLAPCGGAGAAAERFVDYLGQPRAAAVLERAGFEVFSAGPRHGGTEARRHEGRSRGASD